MDSRVEQRKGVRRSENHGKSTIVREYGLNIPVCERHITIFDVTFLMPCVGIFSTEYMARTNLRCGLYVTYIKSRSHRDISVSKLGLECGTCVRPGADHQRGLVSEYGDCGLDECGGAWVNDGVCSPHAK